MLQTWWKHKILNPLQQMLTQGIGARKLALSFAVGVTVGTLPVLGATTVLGTLVAFLFRLNLPVIQLTNYLVYPLQLLLLVPFHRLGGQVFGARQTVDLTALKHMLSTSLDKEVGIMLMTSTFNAIGIWLLLSPLALALLYAVLKPASVRINDRVSQRRSVQQ